MRERERDILIVDRVDMSEQKSEEINGDESNHI